MKRRSFTLIEVLISLALVSLCAIPLLRPHFHIAREKESERLNIERTLKAEAIFEKVQLDLYHNKIPWKAISGGKVRPKIYKGENFSISEIKHHDKKAKTFRLLNIDVVVDDQIYSYHLYTERLNR